MPEIMTRAANGDKSALVEMAEVSAGMAVSGYGSPLICLVESCTFARLAAAGGDNIDRARLVSTSSLLGDELQRLGQKAMADVQHGEAVAHLNALADAGEEFVENNMQSLADHSTPEQLEIAKLYERSWRQKENVDG